jgi:hypothetical protein
MARTSSSHARRTCETYNSIDVRKWHRRGLLHAGQQFHWSWTRNDKVFGRIAVRTERDAVILTYLGQDAGQVEWKQHLALEWTACNFGGSRPWFCCPVDSGRKRCGRRVAILYCAGRLFACRRCYGLAYECQRQNPRNRGLSVAKKIRRRLGGGPDMLEPFPQKPKRMHLRTYERLRARAESAALQGTKLTVGRRSRQKIQTQ